MDKLKQITNYIGSFFVRAKVDAPVDVPVDVINDNSEKSQVDSSPNHNIDPSTCCIQLDEEYHALCVGHNALCIGQDASLN